MNMHSTSHPWPTAPLRDSVSVDPIVLQIVEGTLNSIEAEIEYAIERTARSPMIREAHDFRVGLFDRYCRKLTGRSYSAMPNGVVRDFPPETMKPGDAFFKHRGCGARHRAGNPAADVIVMTEGLDVGDHLAVMKHRHIDRNRRLLQDLPHDDVRDNRFAGLEYLALGLRIRITRKRRAIRPERVDELLSRCVSQREIVAKHQRYNCDSLAVKRREIAGLQVGGRRQNLSSHRRARQVAINRGHKRVHRGNGALCDIFALALIKAGCDDYEADRSGNDQGKNDVHQPGADGARAAKRMADPRS